MTTLIDELREPCAACEHCEALQARAATALEEKDAALRLIADEPCPHPGYCAHSIARSALRAGEATP